MRYVIKTSNDKEKALEAIGVLVRDHIRGIVAQYTDSTYLRFLETNLTRDFGSNLLEAGSINFVKAANYEKRKDDLLLDPNKPKELEKILKGK